MTDAGAAAGFNCGDQKTPTWHERAEVAAELLAGARELAQPGATVADIGCGDGKLRDALRGRGLTAAWCGYDLRPQLPEVVAFDVVRDTLPPGHAAAVLLGVVEYLADPTAVLAMLAREVPVLVVSHVLRDPATYPPARLAELGWNDLVDEEGFAAVLAASGWRTVAKRRTPDGRALVWSCERAAAGVTAPPASARAVLTPYPIPPSLRGTKVENVGDGFILRALERYLGPFAPERVLSPRTTPSEQELARLQQARVVILGGANQLHDHYTGWPGLTAARLRALDLVLVPFGIGVHGMPGRNDSMSDATRDLLLAMHERIALSSWRCSATVAYLRREVPQLAPQLVMTGCPVVHDRPLLEGAAFSPREDHVAVTVTERDDFAAREEAVLAFVAERFRRARRSLVLHQNWSPPTRRELWRHRWWPQDRARLDRYQQLRQVAVRCGFRVVCPRSADEALAFYGGVDVHVGSRLHAHLLCLSRAKRSWLVPVDGRSVGIARDLGFPLCQPHELAAAMDFDFEIVRANARAHHAEMFRFLASIPR
jgi:hypothetical protein